MCSKSIGKLTSQEPTTFYILKLVNCTGLPNFYTIHANFQDAIREAFSFFAPVQTIFPDAKIKAVVFGCLNLITTAANLLGLYSAFLACSAIYFKFKGQLRFTVETIFYNLGIITFFSSYLFN